MRAASLKVMVIGALFCIGGIIATAAGASMAESNHGGTYIVFTGAIIFGAIQFFRGLFGLVFNR